MPPSRTLHLRGLGVRVNPVVFPTSAALIILFLVLGSVFQESTRIAFDGAEAFIVGELGWIFPLAVTGFLGFVLWLLVSPYVIDVNYSYR